MGIHIIKMPDIGEGIAEVELVGWHVNVGDTVAEDQPLADVMTDKATVEIPSPVVGKVVALGGSVGDTLAVGSELIRLEVEGAGNAKADVAPARAQAEPAAADPGAASGQAARAEGLSDSAPDARGSSRPTPGGIAGQIAGDMAKGAAAAAGAAIPARSGAASHSTMPARPAQNGPARQPGERPLASPAVRKRAWDMGIELRFVQGSGPAGRIVHEDLDAYLQGQGAAAPAASAGYRERHDEQEVPVVGLRRKIAQKMQESKRRIPHFSYVEEIDVTDIEALRAQLNRKYGESRGKLTLLPLLARAMVIALRDFPQINARYDDEAGVVTRHGAVHLGVATQTDQGLIVPVLRHAEARDVWQLAAEITRLAQAVRSGKAERDALSGSTITLTSLGALGGIVSTPVINHPEVGIVGVNRIVERPVIRQGAVVARKLMNLSSSFDHRVVDGMDAAQFIQAVRALLEQPALLFVEAP
ncbi:2-oxo acid dehydrogenase subunit E2 [Bordetella petrii]|nr:2-oxo acid dehydrogenase subunit E2 [Bordetella petrii]